MRPMSDNVTSGPAPCPRPDPGPTIALLRASNGSATFWLNVGNRSVASGGPAGFLEGDCGLPQPQCSDALSLGEGRGPTRSPASTQGTRLGVRVQKRARRLGQRAKPGSGLPRTERPDCLSSQIPPDCRTHPGGGRLGDWREFLPVASRFRSDRTQGKTPVAGLELISTFAGSHRWPSLSPDGRMVAFVSDAAGTPQVWVKNLGGGVPIQITFGDLPALRPRWSARGDRIIYSVRGGGIWSVAPLGGEPRRIVENGWNADLSPDGQRLVFERPGQILTANADGSEVVPLPGLQREVHPLLR